MAHVLQVRYAEQQSAEDRNKELPIPQDQEHRGGHAGMMTGLTAIAPFDSQLILAEKFEGHGSIPWPLLIQII